MYGQYMNVDIGYHTCGGGGGGGQLVSVMITLHGRWMKGGYIFIHYSCVGAFVHAWHLVEWACVKCILLFKLYD